MSEAPNKRLEAAAYVSIIVLALVTSGVLVKRYWLDRRAAAPRDPRIVAGTKLSLPALNLGRSERTLILGLSTTCHFCTESAPFYRKLAEEASKLADVRLVAVLPQPAAESRQYLEKLGVRVEVVEASLDSVSASGTPTLILVDKAGVVRKSWVGRLPEREEADVIAHLKAAA